VPDAPEPVPGIRAAITTFVYPIDTSILVASAFDNSAAAAYLVLIHTARLMTNTTMDSFLVIT
jgi:hypothetical protein